MSNLKEVYKETLTQVLALETKKKDLSRVMLQQHEGVERRRTIMEFINMDLLKHNMLAQMLAQTTNQQDLEVLASIGNLYGVGDSEELWAKVESHQRLNRRMLDLLEREIEIPGQGDFVERRLLMEIEKQALRQARDYMNPLQNS